MSDKQALFEHVDKYAETELETNAIYKVGNYGWLDAYTADPQMIGHAMWQTDPPVGYLGEPELDSTNLQKQLMVLGADFEGLMELARSSFGMALWRKHEKITDYFSDNAKYWAHYTGTLLVLSMASDRLREFFVIAYFNTEFASYGNQRREFKSPFFEAQRIPHAKVTSQLKKLIPLIEDIQARRAIRNSVVHRVATRPGKMSQKIFNARRRVAGKSPVVGAKKAFEKWQRQVIVELETSAAFLASWYKTLIHASSLVFEIEHRLRRK